MYVWSNGMQVVLKRFEPNASFDVIGTGIHLKKLNRTARIFIYWL